MADRIDRCGVLAEARIRTRGPPDKLLAPRGRCVIGLDGGLRGGAEHHMSKIMLINVTHAEESRVGIVENGQLESFEIESFSREHLKGNIYKGTVRRIHPAIEAAFVDIGAERDAFLPLDEICFRNLATPPPPAVGENGKRRRRIR